MMDIGLVGSAGYPGGASTTVGSSSISPFLQLVVTELQNQNPLEPVSNTDFLAQLAQFSTLEEMESLNQTLAIQATFSEFGQATSLVGRRVEYMNAITGDTAEGRVDSVLIEAGRVYVEIDGERVSLANIVRVYADEPATPSGTELPPGSSPDPGPASDKIESDED